jgi:hypothetical protein
LSSTLKTGRFAASSDMGWTFDRRGRIGRNDLADHQKIKEHLDGGQVLLDRLRRTGMLFDLSRETHRRDEPNVIDVLLRRRHKHCAQLRAYASRVFRFRIRGRKNLEGFRCGIFASVSQDCRHDIGRAGGPFWRQRVAQCWHAGAHFSVPYRMYDKERMIRSLDGQGQPKERRCRTVDHIQSHRRVHP